MGNKCFAHSGAEVYKKIKFEQYHNEMKFEEKYRTENKVYAKKNGLTTIQVYDKLFSKVRVMKEVRHLMEVFT
jgi:hypothetical protein